MSGTTSNSNAVSLAVTDERDLLDREARYQTLCIPNVVGQRVREMVPDEADDWVKRYVEVLKTGQPIRFEQELVATGRYLELAAFRVEPASRREVAVLFKDITDRKRAERALTELNETLDLSIC